MSAENKLPDFTYPKLFVTVAECIAIIGLCICCIGALTVDRKNDFYTAALWAYFSHACTCLMLLGVALILHVAIEVATTLYRSRSNPPRYPS